MNLLRLTALLTFAAGAFAQSAGVVNTIIPYNPTVVFTATAGVTNFDLTLVGNVTGSTFSSPAVGTGSMKVCQDGTGSRTMIWPTNAVGFKAIDQAPLACSRQAWKYDGTFLQAVGPLYSDNASMPGGIVGLGSAAVQSAGAFLSALGDLSDLSSPAAARTNLGLGTAATQSVGTAFGSLTKNDALQAATSCQDAGSTDAYACSFTPAITAYVTGARYRIKANTINTGAATFAGNGLSAITIKKPLGGSITANLSDGDIKAGQWVELVYDGTNFQMMSQLGNSTGTGDMVASTYEVTGSGAPSNPCATAGAVYRDSSTTPVSFYHCSAASGSWVGPVLTFDSTKSGADLWSGLTSGASGFAVNDVAGTPILYLMPTTNGIAGQVLQDNGTATCPTLAAGMPSVCHQLVWVASTGYIAQDAGSTDAYVCNFSPPLTAYVTGTRYNCKANTINTGAATINANSLGAVTIKRTTPAGITTDLVDGDIKAGAWFACVYDGTNCQLVSPSSNMAELVGTRTANALTSIDANGNLTASGCSYTTGAGLVCGTGSATGIVVLDGVTSGSVAITVNDIAGTGTWTLPGVTDQFVGRDTTDTLTNKTFNTASTGNSLLINGIAVTANTGTGSIVRATSPTLSAPLFSGSTSGTTILQAAATAAGTLTLPAVTDTLVGKATTDTLTNKTLTAPVISTITNTGTLTLPTATTTLVGRTTTDTLTNKTLDSAGTGNVLKVGGQTLPSSAGSAGQRLVINSGATAYVNQGFSVACGTFPATTLTDSTTSKQTFSTTCTIPANALAPGQSVVMDVAIQYTTATSPSTILYSMQIDGTDVYTTTAVAHGASLTNKNNFAHFLFGTDVALGASVAVEIAGAMALGAFAQNQSNNQTAQPITLDTTVSHTVSWGVTYGAANNNQSVTLRRVAANAIF